MRNAMLAAIVLALLGGLAGAASRMSEILDTLAGCPPPQRHGLPRQAAKDAASRQPTNGESDLLPGSATPASGAPAPLQERAERMFTDGLSKDFGVVPFGTQLLHRFKVTNIYSAPVEISRLSCGCSCVTANLGRRILMPGESTTIDVTFDTRTFTGAKTETVRVIFGPNPASICVLKVSAVSQTDVVFNPERVRFGTVTRGQASVQSVEVEYTGPLAWKIEAVIVAKELPFEAELSELVRRLGKVGYRLTVTLKDDAPSGRIRDYIYLKTNQVDAPPVPLLVTASVQAPRSASVAVER